MKPEMISSRLSLRVGQPGPRAPARHRSSAYSPPAARPRQLAASVDMAGSLPSSIPPCLRVCLCRCRSGCPCQCRRPCPGPGLSLSLSLSQSLSPSPSLCCSAGCCLGRCRLLNSRRPRPQWRVLALPASGILCLCVILKC